MLFIINLKTFRLTELQFVTIRAFASVCDRISVVILNFGLVYDSKIFGIRTVRERYSGYGIVRYDRTLKASVV